MSDQWFEGTADSNNGRVVIRALAKLPSEDVRSANSELITIIWSFDGSVADDETFDAVQNFESVLFPAVAQGGWAVEAGSLFSNVGKEWRLYTGDVDNFVAQLNAALDGQPVYPLDLQSFEDPEWAGLSELLPS